MADGGIRASDSDRERVVTVLSEQTSQGRLTLAEFSERTQQVYDARTWDELRALVADLPVRVTFGGEHPAGRSEPAEPTAAARWPSVARRAVGWLGPVLPLVVVAMIVLTARFHLPFAVLIPVLVVGRLAARGHSHGGHGGFGGHRPLRHGRYGPHR